MKRKDFLRKMRNRRRGERLEPSTAEQRRAVDWRTLRFALPSSGGERRQTALGTFELTPDGVVLHANVPCWVRGYRRWQDDEGRAHVEFQVRPVQGGEVAPPGVDPVAAGESWRAQAI